MKNLILMALLPLLLVACGVSAVETPQVPNPAIGKLVGQEYYLSEVVYPGGTSFEPKPNDFTFTIKSPTQMFGRTQCYQFEAETLWGESGTLTLSNNKKRAEKCDTALITFEDEMEYIIAGRYIVLRSKKSTWRTATFELVGE
ncbi:MAG: hypothetical protein KDD38_03940 [Bdellovibrionales bacterium]|nr:hypothetical protein [Bdellovibrionales bacterium]